MNVGAILERYEAAKSKREPWENILQECYEFTLPQRTNFYSTSKKEGRIYTELYDATALDAVDQLAASLLGSLTPAWTQWFGFKAGPDLTEVEAKNIAPLLEDIGKKNQSHFDRSNFIVEMHQCFLDLAIGGTATIYVEETQPGQSSALKFTAVPLHNIVLDEGDNGFLNHSYRLLNLTISQIKERYVDVDLKNSVVQKALKNPQEKFSVLESILPQNNFYKFDSILLGEGEPLLVKTGSFAQSPAISFRWMKSPGEVYGRSPVMKALPDIKTANKVVELILKNASIAVTGIWQADDDGVLNPANIELVPGAIIPKAVGSNGLKPLEMPGRFDISEIVLKDLRQRIRHALLSDKLGPVVSNKMTATEVLERSSQMALLLGATYGRLQTELLTPLIQRAFSILKRRGVIPDIDLDGRTVMIDYRSPLAKSQSQADVQNILAWLDTVSKMGVQAGMSVNTQKTVEHLASILGVPSDLIQKDVSLIPNNISPENLVSAEVLDA